MMEIKTYLQFLKRRWWIIIPILIATFATTSIMTFRAARVYETTASFIVRISSTVDEKNRISALSTLMSSAEIGATYAKVANSRLIRKQAWDSLNFTSEQRGDLSVGSQYVAGTNILEISVQGNDPVVVQEYANAIGRETIAYTKSLYGTYELVMLDVAPQPKLPIKPNVVTNLMMGGILGLALGMSLAFLMEYMQNSPDTRNVYDFLDDSTGLYNKDYFTQRLQQELNRAMRNKRSLTVAVLDIDQTGIIDDAPPPIRAKAMREMAKILEEQLFSEEIFTILDETLFAIILPDIRPSSARVKVQNLLNSMKVTALNLDSSDEKIYLQCAGGIATYSKDDDELGIAPDELLIRAERALLNTKPDISGRILLLQNASQPKKTANTEKKV